MRESILPRMYTATQDTVLGGVIQHVNSKKMVIVLGEPGEGKTVTMLDFCTQYPHPAYYYRCSPNTTMNSLLVFIANAIGVRVVGDNGTVQDRIQRKLQDDPNYCFVFDEAEYLAINVYGVFNHVACGAVYVAHQGAIVAQQIVEQG